MSFTTRSSRKKLLNLNNYQENRLKGMKYLPALLLLALVFFWVGCYKDASQIGFTLQPADDIAKVKSSDTASVYAYSSLVDSVTTSGTPVSLFGSINDPVFGITNATFSAQFRLSEIAYSFGPSPVLDSLVLSLKPLGAYGDSMTTNRIRIFELTEQMVSDSSYYSSSNVEFSSVLLAEEQFVANFSDSVVVGPDTLEPHLRINLSSLTNELGQKLINATDEQMTSNDDFIEFFYGLRLEAVEDFSGTGLIYFDLEDALSKMTVYYSNADEDSLDYDYNLTGSSIRFGNFTHDYSLGDMDFRNQVLSGDTAMGRNVIYAQPLAGVKSRIFLPYIKNWYEDGPISVVEAKLILDGYEEDPYNGAPPSLILLRINSDGTTSPLDEILQGQDFFGGYYDDELNRYFFRITGYIQYLMTGEGENLGLELHVDAGGYIANRFLVNGFNPDDPTKTGSRLRLELIYSTP